MMIGNNFILKIGKNVINHKIILIGYYIEVQVKNVKSL